jgi:hypothetical protein
VQDGFVAAEGVSDDVDVGHVTHHHFDLRGEGQGELAVVHLGEEQVEDAHPVAALDEGACQL